MDWRSDSNWWDAVVCFWMNVGPKIYDCYIAAWDHGSCLTTTVNDWNEADMLHFVHTVPTSPILSGSWERQNKHGNFWNSQNIQLTGHFYANRSLSFDKVVWTKIFYLVLIQQSELIFNITQVPFLKSALSQWKAEKWQCCQISIFLYCSRGHGWLESGHFIWWACYIMIMKR